MTKTMLTSAFVGLAVISNLLVDAGAPGNRTGVDVVHVAEITKAEIAGAIFDRPEVEVITRAGNTTYDFVSHLSSDRKYVSGMYRAGAGRYEYMDSTYGVDEFMYFLEGSVTLTSADGTVHEIRAGEAATIPKEWNGTWDTDGYTKLYVIYSPDEEFEKP